MSKTLAIVATLGVAVLTLGGCAGPGLPPAGPAPGEVDIGYDKQDEEDVTGAVSSVSDARLSDGRPLRIEELLRGRVPGLRIVKGPDGRFTLRIRGTDSLLYDQEPLVVVDGIQITAGSLHTALVGLTPEDIRQIDVLKDVASTSIYGMRGAGGVILITTRR